MNFPQETFLCRKCGQEHRFDTLLEFPLPPNISDISSGKRTGSLKVVSKNIYVTDQAVFVRGNLSFPIINFYDTLDIHNWIVVTKEVFKASFNEEKARKSGSILLEGQMFYPIPFYNMVDLPVVKLSIASLREMPEVKFTISTHEMYTDWKNGITMDRFIQFQKILYHL